MSVWSGLYLLVMALTRLSAAQARVLCLHYYSNALGFNFEDQEEVYREEKIKEWEPVDPADIEVFLQLCLVRGGPLRTLSGSGWCWWWLAAFVLCRKSQPQESKTNMEKGVLDIAEATQTKAIFCWHGTYQKEISKFKIYDVAGHI